MCQTNALDSCRSCRRHDLVNESSLCAHCAAVAAEVAAERRGPNCSDCADTGRIVYGRVDRETIDWDYCHCRKGRVRHREALDRSATALRVAS